MATQRTAAPVLFVGHGSPMNAIEDNSFTRRLNEMGQTMERPRAILAISAHGLTRGTFVTHMKNPRTIHDFYGFPKALFDVQYPAPGSPEIAETIAELVSDPRIALDEDHWGIDHGTWSVLTHLYPRADVPVIQLSIDIAEPPEFHYRLGQSIAAIRDRGVMILGSGNIVHNLQKIRWEKDAAPFDWAVEFDAWVKDQLLKRNHDQLVHDFLTTQAGELSVPTLDHYLPLLYALGASRPEDRFAFEYEGIELGSISMRTMSWS